MDLKNLDLNLLLAFDALVSARSVSRAAQRLCLSQPATSALLAKLREVFQDPLLVRSGRHMLPTEQAMQLAGPIRQVLADIHGILRMNAAFDPALSTRTFTLAATEYGASVMLSGLSAVLERDAPKARLALVAPRREDIVAQMEAGHLDLGVLNQAMLPPKLSAVPLFDDTFCVIARHGHPLIKGALTLERFCALPQALVSPGGGGFSAPTDAALAALGRQRTVRVSVPHFLLLTELIASTDMIAVYPQRLAQRVAGRVQVLAPPLTIPPVTMCLCWHPRAQQDRGHAWLRTQIAANPGPP